MYHEQLTRRDRALTALMVVAIHVVLAFVLINISPAARQQLPEEVVDLLSITEPPPPPVVELQPEKDQSKPKREEGAASARNIESKATPVVQPKPRIQLPVPEPKPATTTPNSGNQNTQGASNVIGPGTGAGGQGTGTGSGGSGNGTGGGGSGGIATRPIVVRGITSRDYPDEVARYWPRGGAVFVAVRVLPNGRATDCKINKSIGVPAIDQWTCRLVEQRAQFRPATDTSGRPVAAWFGYVQQERR
ncbi:energy transducer TonB [Sphingomonas sp. RB56-2]|uniref:Energy transducer TonB n=1 Tax=Sphingomonas brevis TaxID=2908206 RepID=A0ABT0S9G8_9SPHN|nr:TonB family protein [Sphingomonas brevis]MCL6741049.1 energy transducer TonB [Sphingomonas brevis]